MRKNFTSLNRSTKLADFALPKTLAKLETTQHPNPPIYVINSPHACLWRGFMHV